jgi:hypothetical protein
MPGGGSKATQDAMIVRTWGAAVLRPYKVGGERWWMGSVESKSRDLEDDRGYRVAVTVARPSGATPRMATGKSAYREKRRWHWQAPFSASSND